MEKENMVKITVAITEETIWGIIIGLSYVYQDRLDIRTPADNEQGWKWLANQVYEALQKTLPRIDLEKAFTKVKNSLEAQGKTALFN